MELLLFYIEDEAFKILTFGMIDVDRVVGRLMQLMQDADMSATLRGSGEDCQAELVFIDRL